MYIPYSVAVVLLQHKHNYLEAKVVPEEVKSELKFWINTFNHHKEIIRN